MKFEEHDSILFPVLEKLDLVRSNITKDVESIEALEKEIKLLKKELYGLVNERNTLVKINQQLHDNLEALRNDNLQLIEQIALKHDNVKMEEEQHCE